MSARKSIRDNIVTRLLANAAVTAITSTRIAVGRQNVIEVSEGPRIWVYTEREEIATETLSVPRHQTRSMTLVVDFWRKETAAPIDDQLDDAADKITTTVLADTTCGGHAKDLLLTTLEYTMEGNEEAKWGVARLTFTVIYFTRES
jgi:hypothetical protein